MENINFQELFSGMLGKLSEREQNVLKNRYHLSSELDKKITLRQIGETYNITRERVRQIEKEAIRKFIELTKAQEFAESLKMIEQDYINFLEQRGGFVREDYLLDNHVKQNHNFDSLNTNTYLFILEHAFDTTEKIEDHEHFHNVWTLDSAHIEKVSNLISQLEEVLKAENKLYKQAEIIELTKSNLTQELKSLIDNYSEKHNIELERFLESYLHSTSKIESNILEDWGLSEWDTIRPKKLSDKIRLIFQKTTKPLHFKDISEKINEARFDHKKICSATVHNELIANQGFVLIGRGLYALKEWGYTTGTVAEIIKNILVDFDKPMTKDEIYDQVLKQRQVNKSTIYLTLINRNKFVKNNDGKFDLLK